MATNNKTPTRLASVGDLTEVKRRRRLETLLYTRKRVAVLAAEHRSHRLDEAVDLYALQLEVEQVIMDEFPDEYDSQFANWLEADPVPDHHPEVLTRHCSICRAIADRAGINLDAPDAA